MNYMPQSANIMWVIAGVVLALATGTLVRISSLRAAAPELATNRLKSLCSWWLVTGVVVAIAVLGIVAACVVFTVVSSLALMEFLRLAKQSVAAGLKCVSFALIPAAYLLIGFGHAHAFQVFFPVAALALLSAIMICAQRTDGFLNSVARHAWGLLITTYLLGHVALLFTLPSAGRNIVSGAEWFLLLVILTESNDIMQALVGRRFGRRRLAPVVSPNKTWEGFLGGAASTTLLAALIGPWLTPLGTWQAVCAGLLVAVAGLFGDLTISMLKRDAGVKDSGTLLPGHGGILDRVDSLTLTAPAFFFFVTAFVR